MFGDVLEVRITLREIEPPVWRAFRVPADVTLGSLHEIIQAIFGWQNSHLHDFTAGPPPGSVDLPTSSVQRSGHVCDADSRLGRF
jgi:hypothetical protein